MRIVQHEARDGMKRPRISNWAPQTNRAPWLWQLLLVALLACSGRASAAKPVQGAVRVIPTPYNPIGNKTVTVSKSVYLPNTAIPLAAVEVAAAYPDPVLDSPDGWRYKVISNASLVLGSNAGVALGRIDSQADSKLAPAIALGSANLQSAGPTVLLARVGATARPGLQYGVTLAQTDAQLLSTAPFASDGWLTNPVLLFMNQDAVSGQGQTVNLVNAKLQGENVVVGDMRGRSIADRWYLAPGHAVMGVGWDIEGGQAAVFTRNTVRASQGSATSGQLHRLHGKGNIPGGGQIRKRDVRNTRFLAKDGALARSDNRAFVDAGVAQSGNVQLVSSDRFDSVAVGLSQARTAEGNAVAGALNVVSSDNGEVYIGDYWEELSNPGNAVVATNYGRGPAQAGQVNIALSPNAGGKIGGTVVATAVQGGATAGAFTLANGYGELQTDQDVAAVTSEYTASAGNVGVSIAHERSNVINTAVAKTDTGSALAMDIATAAVGVQNSAVGSASASTSTGQAAALSASTGVGGMQAETQGSALAKTNTGNALSAGIAFSGTPYVARSVSTSAATTTDGQALSTGWTASVSADTEAASASSAVVSGTGNAASLTQGYGLGVFEGKGTAASSAASREGSVSSLALGVGTGLILSDSNVASTAQTGDGMAQALAGSLALGGLSSTARASAVAASGTGDVAARADAVGLGTLHGDASSRAVSTTGCEDCVSDAVSNALSVGLVADATAAAKADSPINPGNALANAMAFGYISRTSNGGSSRVAVGPGQALAGGFAVSVSRRVADAAASSAAAYDPAWRGTDPRGQPPTGPPARATPAAGTSASPAIAAVHADGGTLKQRPQQLGASQARAQVASSTGRAGRGGIRPAVAPSDVQPETQNLPQQVRHKLPAALRQAGSLQTGIKSANRGSSGSGSSGSGSSGRSSSRSRGKDQPTLLDPVEVPGSSFMGPMLQKLQATVDQVKELGALPTWGGAFSSHLNNELPMYPLRPMFTKEGLQEQQRQQQEQQRAAARRAGNVEDQHQAVPAPFLAAAGDKGAGVSIQHAKASPLPPPHQLQSQQLQAKAQALVQAKAQAPPSLQKQLRQQQPRQPQSKPQLQPQPRAQPRQQQQQQQQQQQPGGSSTQHAQALKRAVDAAWPQRPGSSSSSSRHQTTT